MIKQTYCIKYYITSELFCQMNIQVKLNLISQLTNINSLHQKTGYILIKYILFEIYSTLYTFSAIANVDFLCETKITVLFRLSCFIVFKITASFKLSKLLVGSSNKIRS